MIKDPSGKIRFLKQLGYSDPVIVLGKDGNDTTIGGVPGALPAGTWQMTVFVFAEHLKRLMGEKTQPFSVLVTEEAVAVPHPAVGRQGNHRKRQPEGRAHGTGFLYAHRAQRDSYRLAGDVLTSSARNRDYDAAGTRQPVWNYPYAPGTGADSGG